MPEQLRVAQWEVIAPTAQSAHMHMALDEVLLDQVINGQRPPTMRLWRWIESALVIGSHQSVMNEVDVAAARELRFVVTRRMSGGGTMLCEPDRTFTYSMYLPETMVAGVSFRKSYALLDSWAVDALVELGVPASYREINDIISPRGKIAGAAQARRRGHVLHHTTGAQSMDVEVLPRLIRVGRESLSGRGVRSAEKAVSPLSWFTSLSSSEVEGNLQEHFAREFGARETELSGDELERARRLVDTKYGTPEWINRLP